MSTFVQTPLPSDLIRIRAWKQILSYNYPVLQDLHTQQIQTINPSISLEDWIQFVYEHTSNDALRRYYTVRPDQ